MWFQICVRCPFEYGVLDGIVMLLCQLISQVGGDFNPFLAKKYLLVYQDLEKTCAFQGSAG